MVLLMRYANGVWWKTIQDLDCICNTNVEETISDTNKWNWKYEFIDFVTYLFRFLTADLSNTLKSK